jgi:fructose-1,6-bisphosphatase/inositol monophosphatase family enzyme
LLRQAIGPAFSFSEEEGGTLALSSSGRAVAILFPIDTTFSYLV